MCIRDRHHRIDLLRPGLQAVEQLRQHVVGVQQRVVVGVDDLALAAAGQIVLLAGRLELLEGRRVAAEVGGPVVAQHVQHHQLAAGFGRRPGQAFGQACLLYTSRCV